MKSRAHHVWVAEVLYRNIGWYVLWTTCRLTRSECKLALEDHPTREDHARLRIRSRIVKFRVALIRKEQ
jgi:hypothetical protein